MHYLSRHSHRLVATLILLVLVLLHSVDLWPQRWIMGLDNVISDTRLRATMPATRDERIVIVNIDEQSLAEVGRWPWPRNKLAQLTDILFDEQKVALLGFDMVFAEPDAGPAKDVMARLLHATHTDTALYERLQSLSESFDNDAVFAKALKHRPVALGYYFTDDNLGRTSGVLPQPAIGQSTAMTQAGAFLQWSGYAANVGSLAQSAPLAGFINSITDVDGVVRSLPLMVEHSGSYYDTLALAMYRRLNPLPGTTTEPLPQWQLRWQADQTSSLRLTIAGKRIDIPLGDRAALRVPYRGPGGPSGGSFDYVSAGDVLAKRLSAGKLAGKIVLVGSSAPGLADMRSTPVNAVYPGVELHANMLSGLLDQRFFVVPADAQAYDVLMLILIGAGLILILPRLSAAWSFLAVGVCVAMVVTLNVWLYVTHGLVLPLAPHLVFIFGALILNFGHGYFVQGRAKRDLVRLFGSYVPPELVREMAHDPTRYNMQARNEELTVMFCDMRGFTEMSETMEPLALQRLLNQLFSELTQLINVHRGTVDKYMGDCVMAFWGAPVATTQHAQLALTAAVAMSEGLEVINAASGRPRIEMGIGLHTGQMCVGDMGSNIRRSYTVVGNAVNLGSRLEGLSKVYGVPIVVSEATYRQTTGYVWQEIDRVRVKGLAQPVTIYTPIAASGSCSDSKLAELGHWAEFLVAYRARHWLQCDILMTQLLLLQPSKPLYALYSDRVSSMRDTHMPKAWDGTTNFETK